METCYFKVAMMLFRLMFVFFFASYFFQGCKGNTKTKEVINAQKLVNQIERSSMTNSSNTDITRLILGDWRITNIDSALIPKSHNIVLTFTESGAQIVDGCNTYSLIYNLGPHSIWFEIAEKSKNSCDSQKYLEEKRLENVISRIDLLDISSSGKNMIFLDNKNDFMMSVERIN